jgi:hypothetical protein
MDPSTLAAQRRFPARAPRIEKLASEDEDFRLLCADLGEAEAALSRWEVSSLPVRDARCAEYATLIESLAIEIEAALGR